MIRSFKDAKIRALIDGKAPKGFPSDIVRAAQRKLTMIDSAVVLDDLLSSRKPP